MGLNVRAASLEIRDGQLPMLSKNARTVTVVVYKSNLEFFQSFSTHFKENVLVHIRLPTRKIVVWVAA